MPEFANPDLYELWMGRWSTRLSKPFVDFARPGPRGRLLDLGCGTGALSATLMDAVPGCVVVGVDPSKDYVAFCRERFSDERLGFEVGDATDLPFDDASFDATLSMLILQEIHDARLAAREMRRVTRPDGLVCTCQWDFADGLPMLALFWDAVLATVPDDGLRARAAEVMEVDFPDPDALRGLWNESGLMDVEIEALEITMDFAGFEDYWRPFTSGVTMTSSVAGRLDTDARERLEANLRSRILGDGADRPFSLPARAWAVRGRVEG